jgi:hypothetical protein
LQQCIARFELLDDGLLIGDRPANIVDLPVNFSIFFIIWGLAGRRSQCCGGISQILDRLHQRIIVAEETSAQRVALQCRVIENDHRGGIESALVKSHIRVGTMKQ